MQTSKKPNKPVTYSNRRSRNPKGQPRPYRDGNRWKAPGYILDNQGNRYSVIGTGSTQIAAQQQLEKNKKKKLASLSISQTPASLICVSAYLRDWLERKKVTSALAYKTAQGYESALNCWILPEIGHLRIQDVQRNHIEKIFHNVAHHNLSRSMQVQIKSVLEPAFRDAVDDGYLTQSPYSKIKLLPPKKSVPAFHDVQAVKAIIKASDLSKFPVRWHLAILYGLRQGEALGLRWTDVNLDADTPHIHVQMQLQRQTGRGLVLTSPKSFKSNRRIPLLPKTVEDLKNLRAAFNLSRRLNGPDWNPDLFLFTAPTGSPIDPANDRKMWIRLMADAEVMYLPLKSARATSATHLNNVNAAHSLLGHTNIGVTARFYAAVPLDNLLDSLSLTAERFLN
jgi:integrase